ncbi:hypothetical protein [Mucilaginibacter sp.]|nr:hypothetical protein [Mucilaginibacter sp.]MDB5031624.1 hypothetical protein [Mucilaginibacter sp.]
MTAIKLKTDKYQLLQHLIDDFKDEGLIDKRNTITILDLTRLSKM